MRAIHLNTRCQFGIIGSALLGHCTVGPIFTGHTSGIVGLIAKPNENLKRNENIRLHAGLFTAHETNIGVPIGHEGIFGNRSSRLELLQSLFRFFAGRTSGKRHCEPVV